jgi:dUTPase
MVFQQVEKINWQLVEQIDATDRGAGGFGSTGKS